MKNLFSIKSIIFLVVIQIFQNGLYTLFAYLLMAITDNLVEGNISIFWKMLIICLITITGYFITATFYTMALNKYVTKTSNNIRKKMFSKIIRKSYQDYSTTDKSEYTSFLINDLDMFESKFIRVIVQVFNSIFSIVLTCIAIIFIRPIFLPIALAMVFISLFMPGLFSKHIRTLNEKYIKENQNFYSLTNEYLEGHEVIKANALAKIIEKKYTDSILSRALALRKFLNLASLANYSMSGISVLLILVIYATAGLLISNNTITIGSLVAVTQLSNNLMTPIADILTSINDINSVRSIKEKIEHYLLHENKEGYTPLEIKQILLSDVSYIPKSADMPILNKINLNFQHGKCYALIGANGCGKSTLLKVISGRIRHYDGAVFYGENVQKDISDRSIDSKISFVTQQGFLFTESVSANLSLFGKLPIKEAVTYCDLLALPKVWLSENKPCHNLSGGEKQKIAIIQSLICQKSILLWDEADSALDKSTRKALYDYIRSINDKLVIVVTHDLKENLNSFDEIITMDNGQITNVQTQREVFLSGEIPKGVS